MTSRLERASPWLAILLVWMAATDGGLVDPLFLASPLDTGKSLLDGLGWKNTDLISASAATLTRVGWGMLVAVVLGVPLGLGLGGWRRFGETAGPLVDAFRSMPATALFPAFLLAFGVGDAAKVAVAAFVCTWALAVFTATGVRSSGDTRRFLLRLHGASRRQRFVDGLLLPALPSILGGIKAALALALVVTIAVEMLVGTTVGLGRTIYIAQTTYRIPDMYSGIMASAAIGIALNGLLALLQRQLLYWEREL